MKNKNIKIINFMGTIIMLFIALISFGAWQNIDYLFNLAIGGFIGSIGGAVLWEFIK